MSDVVAPVQDVPFWCTVAASKVIFSLGHTQYESLEPGADLRRDRLAAKIYEAFLEDAADNAPEAA